MVEGGGQRAPRGRSGEEGHEKGRGELSAAQGTPPRTVFSLKLQEKPCHNEAKPLKCVISCGNAVEAGICVGVIAYSSPEMRENKKRLIPQSPRCEGGKAKGNGDLGVQWTAMDPALYHSRHLVLHSHAQCWPLCLSSMVTPGVGLAGDPDHAEPHNTVRLFLLGRPLSPALDPK